MADNFLQYADFKMKASSFARQLWGEQVQIYSLDIYSEQSHLERKQTI